MHFMLTHVLCTLQRRLESYMSDAEFEKIFSIDRAAWNTWPQWKKEVQRKKNKLW